MQKKTYSRLIISVLLSSFILFNGCSDESNAKVVEEKITNKKIQKEETKQEKKQVVYTKNDKVIHSVFKDIAKIFPDGRYMLMVFGANTDPYSDKLKEDIKNSKKLSDLLKNKLSAYYLKAHENKRIKLFHEGELMDVDTKTMISIYAVKATPTLIFTDKNAKAVVVVPGYMPTKQFIATIEFMESKVWEGKDRKNGEVYEALRDFYISKGIDVKKKAKK